MDFNIGPPKIEDKNQRQEYVLGRCIKEFYEGISDNYFAVHEPEMDSKMENMLKSLNMKKGPNLN